MPAQDVLPSVRLSLFPLPNGHFTKQSSTVNFLQQIEKKECCALPGGITRESEVKVRFRYLARSYSDCKVVVCY